MVSVCVIPAMCRSPVLLRNLFSNPSRSLRSLHPPLLPPFPLLSSPPPPAPAAVRCCFACWKTAAAHVARRRLQDNLAHAPGDALGCFPLSLPTVHVLVPTPDVDS